MDWNFLIKSDTDALCVTTDSRNIVPGCVFVALKGERFNGNMFAAQAIEKGAAYAIVDEDIPATCSQQREYKGQIIRVQSSLKALQDLARAWRGHLGTTIIGITGTNGKTTTKELMAAVLSKKYNVHYTQGNLNNAIGVPLTLLQLTRNHNLAIVEMGASHPGDIRELVDIAEPDCGLITNVGRAHLEGFGSFEGVMKTKAELYNYLTEHRTQITERRGNRFPVVFINEDNANLKQMLAGHDLPTVVYHTGKMPDEMHLVGEYNAENVSAARAVGQWFGVSEEESLQAVKAYIPANNRSQAVTTEHNRLVVDAYNANPTSMQAAIQAFDGDTYILGAMRELGDYTRLEHQNIVNMLAERKADKVLLVGQEWKDTTAPYPVFDNVNTLHEQLQREPLKRRVILLKGSHSVQLEKLLDVL